ncbi:uncharacterized protein LOC110104523 isoform X3 [Dendrobium catenatum]|uniref:uncharacterized protein LOC110104523 isoform X3 n=1 Tax=Dendrobium catenatum TaxID=906689 RepID=UPI00109EF0ED|nr:uncharacterized protein LOC110104523 isoform X3 [Dendrobium catenatum]
MDGYAYIILGVLLISCPMSLRFCASPCPCFCFIGIGWWTQHLSTGKLIKLSFVQEVWICLLLLDFATGTRRCFPSFADDIIHAILFVMNNHRSSLINTFEDDDCSKSLRIRLNKYSEAEFSISIHQTSIIRNERPIFYRR